MPALPNNRPTRGVSMVEYAILLALIALISLSVVSLLGTHVKGAFQVVTNCIGSGQGGSTGNGGGSGGGVGGGTGGGRCQGSSGTSF